MHLLFVNNKSWQNEFYAVIHAAWSILPTKSDPPGRCHSSNSEKSGTLSTFYSTDIIRKEPQLRTFESAQSFPERRKCWHLILSSFLLCIKHQSRREWWLATVAAAAASEGRRRACMYHLHERKEGRDKREAWVVSPVCWFLLARR